jgi:hypothetical protein
MTLTFSRIIDFDDATNRLKILKIAKHAVVATITQLINLSINTCTFPDKLKIAQVVPIHKKNSTLLKGNNRPVSILPPISKNFERAIDEQLIGTTCAIFSLSGKVQVLIDKFIS